MVRADLANSNADGDMDRLVALGDGEICDGLAKQLGRGPSLVAVYSGHDQQELLAPIPADKIGHPDTPARHSAKLRST